MLARPNAVLAATTDVGGNAVIDLGGGDSVTLTGVLKAQLQRGDVDLSAAVGGHDTIGGVATLAMGGGAHVQGWANPVDILATDHDLLLAARADGWVHAQYTIYML
ncbi:hypothetical protein RLEG12_23105 [Rhizobium leguminosarum bv. trifolii CB782]|uniref:Uncharacterized protein n=1 Tax=Rhizobium hidalgonense TaxID=1538159 RepID=A0AAJ2GTD3_9HYPH|nr:hypothetical protein [Rhizobium hidalgonense]AHG47936.1 hypothetical protein RLEG12_23105 [Rhizobium leguminosarum bv. trifolii CB782]MDR9772688.1 hypothetical protein [Rhizobium hidalgonense]MDR9813767.1 hypothetical protein [Rhizobium hidalgonense]MDR9821720.1 hypothetical protein [Rhizobium hidalgonense]QKK23279.1 hypothetical protein FFM81_007890 [Rhizobium hidalgonense]